MGATVEACRVAAERALEFLERRQHHTGEFKMDFTFEQWIDPATGRPGGGEDQSPFSASYIVHSLSFSDHPAAQRMTAKAMRYFRDQELPGGMWRYWNKGTAPLGDIPTDADDTSCISELIDRFDPPAPDNKWLLLLNRDSRNLFYTWITPRLGSGKSRRYWSVVLSDVTFERLILFWRRSPAARGDIDSVVNANVALYFGAGRETEPVVDYLLQIVRDGRESTSDKWYPDTNTFYYAVSRCYDRGMKRLGDAVPQMLSRFAAQAGGDGRIGTNDMLTALAAGAILNFRADTDLLVPAIDYILKTQQDDGGWPSRAFYTNGSRPAQTTWGSRELTTGFCLEAIERYSRAHASA